MLSKCEIKAPMKQMIKCYNLSKTWHSAIALKLFERLFMDAYEEWVTFYNPTDAEIDSFLELLSDYWKLLTEKHNEFVKNGDRKSAKYVWDAIEDLYGYF